MDEKGLDIEGRRRKSNIPVIVVPKETKRKLQKRTNI